MGRVEKAGEELTGEKVFFGFTGGCFIKREPLCDYSVDGVDFFWSDGFVK